MVDWRFNSTDTNARRVSLLTYLSLMMQIVE